MLGMFQFFMDKTIKRTKVCQSVRQMNKLMAMMSLLANPTSTMTVLQFLV